MVCVTLVKVLIQKCMHMRLMKSILIYKYRLCNGNARQAAREYQHRCPNRSQPVCSVFSLFFSILQETGNPSLQNTIRSHEVNVQDNENYVLDDLSVNSQSTASNLQLSHNFVTYIEPQNAASYDRPNVQALHPGDVQEQLAYCHWVLESNQRKIDFISEISLSDVLDKS